MPSYHYRAVTKSGQIRKGQLAAANENELSHFLSGSGLELIEAREKKNKQTDGWTFGLRRERAPLHQRVKMCSQLEDLLLAGLPFLEALQTVAANAPQGPLREILHRIAQSIGHGSSLSNAFGQYPHLFNLVFIAILAAGERSGDLAATFAQLAEMLQRQERFQSQLRRALRYPLFLLCVAMGVTTFMMTMVVPPIVEFLNANAGALPFMTRLLIGAASLFADMWWMALLAVLAGGIGLVLARRHSESFAQRTDGWLLALPGLGPVLRKLALARFAHGFAVLLQGGADLPSSLRLSANVLGNRALIAMANEAERRVQAGEPFSVASSDLFPPFVNQMLRVAEQSGQMTKALDDAAHTFDNEAKAAVDGFIGALEPALTILVGALLAWIVLAVLGPVYGSLGQMGQAP